MIIIYGAVFGYFNQLYYTKRKEEGIHYCLTFKARSLSPIRFAI